jgi:2-keto-myo-inositol isomerase
MNISFALNQIIMPNSSFKEFVFLAKKLDLQAIEIRNDVATNLIKENQPYQVKDFCEENSLEILTINALQKFNIWNNDRSKEFVELCDYANKAKINGIVLVPLNDGSITNEKEQAKLLEDSLKNIASILQDYNLISLVEPLGFRQSSLRNKSIATKVIENINTTKLKILHDTFHHALSDENDFFPSLTGLVHVSGVSNKYVNTELTDDHRSIIDENDILENIIQIKKFSDSGYQGFFSFEPFANSLIQSNNVFESTKKTFDFIKSHLR